MTKKRSTKHAGDSTERVVAKHYEALGFRVTPNVNIRGHQIDLLASKYLSGASQFNLMVEVKSRSAAPVGVNDVTPFLNTASHLLCSSEIQGAALVTDGSFSQDARQAAHNAPGIRLLTIEELEQDLFNFSESLLRLVYEYESSPIYREYVPLEGSRGERKKHINDVAAHILRWSQADEKLLVLVGDFGSGKSTVLERVNYLQAHARLQDPNVRFPILLRLRRLLQCSDLWTYISTSLRDTQMISPSRAAFDSKLTSGQLLLLLDGFDEIHTGANAQDRASYLKTLAPLLTSGSPCVLSTRPMYFDSFTEMARSLSRQLAKPPSLLRIPEATFDLDRLLDRLQVNKGEMLTRADLETVVQLSHLDDEKVGTYLGKFESELQRSTRVSSDDVKRFLYRIYDLEDLMKRPLLLHMVVATVIAGKVDLSNQQLSFGPSTLYDLYTQLSVQRDQSKNALGQFLSEQERLNICRKIAVCMLDKGTIELSAHELRQAVGDAHLPTIGRALMAERTCALEKAITDIRVCTFLSRADDGSLRFAHKSYFEFFVAQEIVISCASTGDALAEFAKRRLAKEIVYFLGSFARDLSAFGQKVLSLLRSAPAEPEAIAALCRRIAFAAGTLLQDLRLAGGAIRDVDLRRSQISGVTFDNVELRSVSLRDVGAVRWKLVGCRLADCSFESCTFQESEFVVDGESFHLDGVSLRDCAVSFTGKEWSLRNSAIERSSVVLGGAGLAKNVRFDRCGRVVLLDDLRLSAGSEATFAHLPLSTSDRTPWYEEGAELNLVDCDLVGVRLEARDVVALTGRVRGTKPRITLNGCSGIVLTSSVHSDYAARLVELFPDLVFYDLDALRESLHACERGREQASANRDATDLPRSVAETVRARGFEKDVTGLLARCVAVVGSGG